MSKYMGIKTTLQRLTIGLLTILFVCCYCIPGSASAKGYEDFTPEQLEKMHIYFAKGDYSCGGNAGTGNVVGAADEQLHLSAHQVSNIKTIIGIAKTYNLGEKGALIGLMTAIVESHIRMYASSAVPVSKENPAWLQIPPPRPSGQDFDSVGIFQQRVSTGWSTFGNGKTKEITWQLMDPAYSAQAFFGTPKGAKLPDGLKQPSALKKGLQNLDNWQSMDPGKAAQSVQISAFPARYNEHKAEAQSMVNKYWADSPAIPLPISITGGTASTGTGTEAVNCDAGLSGTATDRIISTIRRYAWPDYCKAGSRSCAGRSGDANTMKEDYVKDLNVQRRGTDGKPVHPYKGSCNGVDCGAFVTLVMRASGVDPDYNKANGDTGGQLDYLLQHSQGASPKYHHLKNSDALQSGDIAVKNGHTFIYIGKVEGLNGSSASASQCERAPMAGPTDTRAEYQWFRFTGPALAV